MSPQPANLIDIPPSTANLVKNHGVAEELGHFLGKPGQLAGSMILRLFAHG
jgi:hypothetical protein